MSRTVQQAWTREQPVDPRRTALLLVDVQNQLYRDAEGEAGAWLRSRVESVVLPNLARLIVAARAAGAEVMYTVIENLTADGRDRGLDYKLSGIDVKNGSWEAQVIEEVAPAADDIVLKKTSSSLFNSTNFDFLLRNLGIEHLIVTGLLTDQCVDQTVRDGADRGYRVICVADCCATYSLQRHTWALTLFSGYCRRLATDTMIAELRAAALPHAAR